MDVERVATGEPRVPAERWLLKSFHCPDVALSIPVPNEDVFSRLAHSRAACFLLSNLPVLPGVLAVETNEAWMDWLLSSLFFQDL